MGAAAKTPESTESHAFQAEVSQVLNLVVNSLYSNKEIFLRELVSNASDALDKRRFAAITDKALAGEGALGIRLDPDAEAKTLDIIDDGIGMSKDELVKNLGTIAHSGTQAFLAEAQNAANKDGEGVELIGQFGVGFYAAFLVADRVEVTSRAAGSDEAWCWSSDAADGFTVAAAQRDSVGTTVRLHLKEAQELYAQPWQLRQLVKRYSDFVSHPIQMQAMVPPPAEGEEAPEVTEPEWETINAASALWQRPKDEVTEEQYGEFYEHLTGDFQGPLAQTHFRVEGTQLFTGLIYLPKKAPFDLFMREFRRGVRLYVKRVFIMDDAEDLVPPWLRFVKGVIDSDDLPLNVSRELLQDSTITRTIRKQVVKKTLDLLESLASDRPEDYETFWGEMGAVLKEGLHFDPSQGERIAKLVRYESSQGEGLTSLTDYVARMPEGQSDIYYIIGESRAQVAGSPHLEALKKKGWEVIYMTDTIDEWAVHGLGTFDEKKLVSVTQAELDIDGDAVDEEASKAQEEGLKGLTDAMRETLEAHVSEVRLSRRLTDSPACLVVPEGGVNAHLERMLRMHDPDMAQQKRILELNPDHVVVTRLKALHGEAQGDQVSEWTHLLYEQALLTEGSPLPDPPAFARRVTALMTSASDVVDG